MHFTFFESLKSRVYILSQNYNSTLVLRRYLLYGFLSTYDYRIKEIHDQNQNYSYLYTIIYF